MQRVSTKYKNVSGMTLVEILVSLVILGLILISIFPLITQSLQVVNLSNAISTQLFSDQDEIEVVAVTKDGAFLEDGTFIPVSSFSVFTGDDTTWVAGMTVKKDKLIRFFASRLGYKNYTFNVIEGYTSSEGTFIIEDGSIKADDNYSITATDKHGSFCSLSNDTYNGSIEFTLPTDSFDRFTNYGSPYLITVTNDATDETQEIASLFVRLPKAVIAGSSGLLISSSNIPSNWVEDGNTTWVQKSKSLNKINKIINIHNSADGRNCFVAIADGGSVYIWKDGSNSFESVSLPGAVGTRNLNDIILIPNTVMIVGDGGLVIKGEYQFTDDDMTWTWSVVRDAGNGWENSNLRAITYKGSGEYYLVGDSKLMLKYTNNFQVLTSNNPSLATGAIKSGMPSVRLTPDGDYLQTTSSPVTGNSSRTIFMVVKPDNVANISLFTMAAANSTANQFLTLRTDSQGRLAVQSTSSNMVSSNLQLTAGTAYIVSCRYDTNNIILSLNGASNTLTLPGTLNTSGSIQLGSDSLTPVTDTSDLAGYIGDVFLFNGALGKDVFSERIWYLFVPIDYDCAPEMDIATHYLSVKYGINTSINKENHYFRDYDGKSPIKLGNINWRGGTSYWIMSGGSENTSWWPYRTSTSPYSFPTAIWLDAYKLSGSSGQRLTTWTPRTGGTTYNFTVPALKDLNAVACYDSVVIAGGIFQNLFKYDPENSTLSLADSSNASKYQFEDMLFVDDKIIALLNRYNDSDTSNSISSISESFEISSLRSSTSRLNDIYSYNDGALLIVTGNNGTILYSEDSGATWSSSDSGTSQHLYTGCIR